MQSSQSEAPYWQTFLQSILDEQGHIIINSLIEMTPGAMHEGPCVLPNDALFESWETPALKFHVVRAATQAEYHAQLNRFGGVWNVEYPFYYAVVAE